MNNFKYTAKITILMAALTIVTVSCKKDKNEVVPEVIVPEDFTPPADFAGMTTVTKQRAKEYGAMPTTPKTLLVPNDVTPIIKTGESIASPNGNYKLTIENGKLILYKKLTATTQQALWESNSTGGNSLFFQTDGNLVLYRGTALGSQVAWAGNTDAGAGLNKITGDMAVFALQDDGDFVMYWKHNPPAKTPRKWILAATDTKGGVVSAHGNTLDHVVN